MPHLKIFKSLLQSCLAILEQCAHLALMKKILELVAILLSFNKSVDFVEGPDSSDQYQGDFFFSNSSNTLCEFPNMLQYTWWQFPTHI
jgi:hypothetical protein